MMTEEFWKSWQRACYNFVLLDTWQSPDTGVLYVHAEADTGSRYEVIRTRFKESNLLTVLQPYQTGWTTQSGPLYPAYVLEHFRPQHRTVEQCHGGDMAAVTIALNYAIGAQAWSLPDVRRWAHDEAKAHLRRVDA